MHSTECILKRLNEKHLGINLPKSHFAKLEFDCLGYHIPQSCVRLIESKCSAILSPEAPYTLKENCSYLGSVHYIIKFIPNLALISLPLRPLLKKFTKLIWTDTHENCSIDIKSRILNATENFLYSPHLETLVKCDASRFRLGAAHEQLIVDELNPIATTS